MLPATVPVQAALGASAPSACGMGRVEQRAAGKSRDLETARSLSLALGDIAGKKEPRTCRADAAPPDGRGPEGAWRCAGTPGPGVAAGGIGFSAFGDRFTSTPQTGLGLSDAGRDYSLGWRLTRAESGPGSVELSIDATRRESANENVAPDHGIWARLTARF